MDTPQFRRALGGRTRASTMKRYFKTWKDWRCWWEAYRDARYKPQSVDLAQYLFSRFDEPCGPTIPALIIKAVNWMETTGDFQQDDRVADSQLVGRVRDYVVEKLAKDAKPIRRAPRYPATFVLALEDFMMDENNLVGLRLVAWAKLLKIWGTLRFDDLQGMRPREIFFQWGRLSTILRASKTSGPSRRVQELPVCISEHAYILDHNWLQCGWKLMKDHADFERDYLFPRLNNSWTGFQRKEASYQDMMTYSACLFARLTRSMNGRVLIPRVLVSFWTEHSERATLPTGLAFLETEKVERDLLGRWRPDGSDSYQRSYNGLVARLQKKYATAARDVECQTILDEVDIVQAAEGWLRDRRSWMGEAAIQEA